MMFDVDANGTRIPALGLGTFGLTGGDGQTAVETAIEIGYRHLDTAQAYGNEGEVGAAIRSSGIARDQFFVTTKVWPDNLGPDRFLASVEESLSRLGVDHVNLLLIHWPVFKTSLADTVELLVQARERGFTRAIGVSNFNRSQVTEASKVSGGTLAVNQVEYHPFLKQDALLETLRAEKMALTAYTPLAKGRIVDEPTISSMADMRKLTPAQVTLRWLIQQPGVIAIPKSSSPERLRENFDVFSFELSEDEMHAINYVGAETGRLTNPAGMAPDWSA